MHNQSATIVASISATGISTDFLANQAMDSQDSWEIGKCMNCIHDEHEHFETSKKSNERAIGMPTALTVFID